MITIESAAALGAVEGNEFGRSVFVSDILPTYQGALAGAGLDPDARAAKLKEDHARFLDRQKEAVTVGRLRVAMAGGETAHLLAYSQAFYASATSSLESCCAEADKIAAKAFQPAENRTARRKVKAAARKAKPE